ncbi:sperm motility kinase W [Sigmodon hispidus]
MACDSQKKSLKSQYKILITIGQGAFGTVKLAYHRLTNTLVAIKVLENNEKQLRYILSEIAILERVHHPNIIRLFQIVTTSAYFNIITEYAPGGDLFQLIMEKGKLQEQEAQKIFGQMVSAIKYCHNLDIVHRDIKPQNILLDAEGDVKLIDFGLAKRCRSGTIFKGRCGTKSYNAPELVLGEFYNGKKADVWSLGVVLYFITIGHHPFKRSSTKETDERIITGTYEVPSHISGQLENLIHQMMTVAPERRPSIDDLQELPWVIKYGDKIPSDRHPDSNILGILSDLGFDTNAVLKSLKKREYDEVMGTYLIIQEQVRKGFELNFNISTKPVNPSPAPSHSPVHSFASTFDLKRRASEPTISPSQHHPPVVPKPSGQKLARNASMPSLCYTQKKSPTFSSASPSKDVVAPCVCSNILEEKMPLPPGPYSDIKTSPPQNIGRFKRLRQRIRTACLSLLCCFPRASNTQN